MAENSPNLVTGINVHIQETHQIPVMISSKRFIVKNIIIKPLKPKCFESTKKKVIYCVQGILNKIDSYFLSETMDARGNR